MRYKVFDKIVNGIINDYRIIVTQNGEVAWWDESQGWSIDGDQGRYSIILEADSDDHDWLDKDRD